MGAPSSITLCEPAFPAERPAWKAIENCIRNAPFRPRRAASIFESVISRILLHLPDQLDEAARDPQYQEDDRQEACVKQAVQTVADQIAGGGASGQGESKRSVFRDLHPRVFLLLWHGQAGLGGLAGSAAAEAGHRSAANSERCAI